MASAKRNPGLVDYGMNGRKAGRDPRKLTPADLEVGGIKQRPPLAAIQAKCLECMGGDKSEVRKCAAAEDNPCPLWDRRMGNDPWRRRNAESLKKARAAKAALAQRRSPAPGPVAMQARP